MSQQIPKGYELESVLDFEEDGRTVSGIVYATSDSKFLIVRDGYKTTTFYVFSTESYKLTNKVTIDTYIPSSSFFYKNGVFIAKSKRDKKIYTFNAFKNSENGKVIQINKSNELLAGFNFQKLQETSTPYYYKNNMFVWNAARFAYDTTISVLKPIKTVIVNNTTIDNLEETETDIKGQYYALIVGINEYEDESIVDLDNPTKDSSANVSSLSSSPLSIVLSFLEPLITSSVVLFK